MSYENEINRVLYIMEESGFEKPLRFSDEQWMLSKLSDLFDELEDAAYSRGMDSVHACCAADCMNW